MPAGFTVVDNTDDLYGNGMQMGTDRHMHIFMKARCIRNSLGSMAETCKSAVVWFKYHMVQSLTLIG